MIKNFFKYIKPKSENKILYIIEYIILTLMNFIKLVLKKYSLLFQLNFMKICFLILLTFITLIN